MYPFVRRGTLCAIINIPVRRRHLLLLILDTKGFTRTSMNKDMQSIQIPAPFLFDGSLRIVAFRLLLRAARLRYSEYVLITF